MTTLPVTSGIALFAVAILSTSALTDASALMDDDTLTKYSPNEVGNGEFEMQMTTNIARMPSFNPLGNIFSKTLPALIPTG